MPTARGIEGPYRFFFFSFDCHEPRHIHVQRDRFVAKFWLDPITVSKNQGFSPRELHIIRTAVRLHADTIKEAWDEHCG